MRAPVEAAPVTVPTIASIKVSVTCMFSFAAADRKQADYSPY